MGITGQKNWVRAGKRNLPPLKACPGCGKENAWPDKYLHPNPWGSRDVEVLESACLCGVTLAVTLNLNGGFPPNWGVRLGGYPPSPLWIEYEALMHVVAIARGRYTFQEVFCAAAWLLIEEYPERVDLLERLFDEYTGKPGQIMDAAKGMGRLLDRLEDA